MGTQGIDDNRSWIAAFICCGINFLTVGLLKTLGLIFVEIMRYFQISRKKASLIIVLASTMRCFTGPIAGYIGPKLGLHTVILAGFLIKTGGLCVGYFAEDIFFLYITWSAVGIGAGFILCLIPQVTNVHFKKHFSKANGLTIAGSSIGGVIFVPIVEKLLSNFGLFNTFLIMGGIAMHGIPMALILRILAHPPRISNIKANSRKSITINIIKCENAVEKKNSTEVIQEKASYINCNKVPNLEHYNKNECESAIANDLNNLKTPSLAGLNSSKTFLSIEKNVPTTNDKCSHDLKEAKIKLAALNNNDNKPLNHIKILESNEQPSIRTTTKKISNVNLFKLFINPTYLIIAFTIGSVIFFIITFPSICVDFILDKGMSIEESANLLMIMYGTDIVGRLTLGWITDKKYITRINFTITGFFLIAIANISTIWTTGFFTMMISMMFHSISLSTITVGTIGLIPQYIEEHQQALAMASSQSFSLPFTLIIPTLIGYFRDELKSYNWMMTFLGSVGILNGLLLMLLPFVEKWRTQSLTKCKIIN